MLLCSWTRPPRSLSAFRRFYPGGGCSEPELSHQSKHKCMSRGPEATWFSLCLFVSLAASTSVFQCLISFRPICTYYSILYRKWLGAKIGYVQKPTVFFFFFFYCDRVDFKTNFKTKNKTYTGKRSLLPVKHRLWNKKCGYEVLICLDCVQTLFCAHTCGRAV